MLFEESFPIFREIVAPESLVVSGMKPHHGSGCVTKESDEAQGTGRVEGVDCLEHRGVPAFDIAGCEDYLGVGVGGDELGGKDGGGDVGDRLFEFSRYSGRVGSRWAERRQLVNKGGKFHTIQSPSM